MIGVVQRNALLPIFARRLDPFSDDILLNWLDRLRCLLRGQLWDARWVAVRRRVPAGLRVQLGVSGVGGPSRRLGPWLIFFLSVYHMVSRGRTCRKDL